MDSGHKTKGLSEVGCTVLPQHFFLRDTPRFTVVWVTLIEKVGAMVLVGEQVRMTAFAAVPFTGFAVGLEGFIA